MSIDMMFVVLNTALIFGVDPDDFGEVGLHGVGVVGEVDGVLVVGEDVAES